MKSAVEALYQSNFEISISTCNRCLCDLLVTAKKHIESLTAVIMQERFNNYLSVDFANIVFVDESSFDLYCHRNQARSKIDTMANILIPTVRGRTLISSISIAQMLYSKVFSNFTVNGDVFFMYLTDFVHI